MWETKPELVMVELEVVALIMNTKCLLVQLIVRSSIVNVVIDFARVPSDDVLSLLQLVDEMVQLDKVNPVFGQVDVATVLIIFRTQENFNHSLGFLVRIDVNLVGERFMVEAFLGNMDLETILNEFLRSDVDSIAQISVEVVEVGNQSIDFYVLYMNTMVR